MIAEPVTTWMISRTNLGPGCSGAGWVSGSSSFRLRAPLHVGSEAANELVPLVGAEDQVAVLAERPVRRTTEEHPDLDVRASGLVAETKTSHAHLPWVGT